MVIVDAGGGTIDISSYSRDQKGGFEEIATPQCSFRLHHYILKFDKPAHYIKYQVTSAVLFL